MIGILKQSNAREMCFTKWQRKRNFETYQICKQAKKHSTKAIRETKRRAFDDLYARLEKEEGKKIYSNS